MPKLYAVNPADVARVWDAVSPSIQSAIAGDTQYDIADIRSGVEAKTMQLWLGMEGQDIASVAVTQIVAFPRMKFCDLFVISGENIAASVPLPAGIEQWARAEGCAEVRGCGREGRKQHLLSGWSAFATLYRKTL